jgi:hypothetical protein
MTPEPRLPTSLKVVAGLFILSGTWDCIQMLLAPLSGRLWINTGVIALFIGWGLLRLKPVWRTWAMIMTWLGMIGMVAAVPFILNYGGPLHFNVFGQKYDPLPRSTMVALFVALCVAYFALGAWQLWVLTRPPIAALFRRPAPEQPPRPDDPPAPESGATLWAAPTSNGVEG